MTLKHRNPKHPARGFSLIEAMISIAIAATVSTTALNIFKQTIDDQQRASREWSAFTIAEQRMELLANAPSNSSLLNDIVIDAATPGSDADKTCAGGVDGSLSSDMLVDQLGNQNSGGVFQLCWKITAGNPQGSLRNVRVVVTFPTNEGGKGNVYLQTFR
jgi:prepilin-type N-terminal cleavage/methylation domain-containing protein